MIAFVPVTMADREASGLLMSVIRTLHETDTGQEREEQKRKLEQEFKSCDAKLDKLVAKNQNELSNVMGTYSTLSSRLHKARASMNPLYAGCELNPFEPVWLRVGGC